MKQPSIPNISLLWLIKAECDKSMSSYLAPALSLCPLTSVRTLDKAFCDKPLCFRLRWSLCILERGVQRRPSWEGRRRHWTFRWNSGNLPIPPLGHPGIPYSLGQLLFMHIMLSTTESIFCHCTTEPNLCR